MSPYCVDLNWDIPLLAPHVDINVFKNQPHTKGERTDIHPLMIQHLESKGISVSMLEAFYSKPNYVMKYTHRRRPRRLFKIKLGIRRNQQFDALV